MAVLKMRFGWLLAVLAILMLAGTSSQAQAVTNTFHVEVQDSQSVQGYCDGDYPRWYYYENTGWWNQWFYNGPYDPDRKKVISVTLTVKRLDPRVQGSVRLAYNWSTPAWKPGSGPPLPPLDSAAEEAFIGRHTFLEANFVPIEDWEIENEYEISEYNPEWVSIDVQGDNFVVEGVIIHECVPKDQPTQACCFDDGHCEDLTEDECNRRGGDPQGANTNCGTVICPQPPIEIDPFGSALGEIEVQMPTGQAETVQLAGPMTWHVYFEGPNMGDADDDDGNGLEEVETEIVSMSLTGEGSMGPVIVRLRPNIPALGQIEEKENNTPGVLDLKPFVNDNGGDFPADSFFDVFFEIEVGGMANRVVLHTEEPSRLRGVITYKPPRPCEAYESVERVELYDEDGNATGIYVLRTVVHPNPCEEPTEACCFDDGTCNDLPPAECIELGGIPQGPGTDCSIVDCDCGWNVGDPHKMHWPQLPGDVDVEFVMTTLADDWRCSRSGPVEDIHFWVSWMQNQQQPIQNFTVIIYSDNPDPDGEGPAYSTPGDILWSRNFGPGDFRIYNMPEDLQDWFDPSQRDELFENDHTLWQRIDICHIPDPYPQEQGKIYWLAISFGRMPFVGWKASRSSQFNDDGVWWNKIDQKWIELRYPPTGESLDLAFVITGGEEPLIEACCFDDGTCKDLPPDQCTELGGVPQGPGTVCSAAPEACCLADGSCIDADPLCCDELGGTPQGPGTGCVDMLVPCCLPDGSCVMVDPLCCDDLGGMPSPIGASQCLGDLNGDGIDDACQELPSDEIEYGDAPEASVAYPSLCVQGSFPTCVGTGPAGWIQHTNSRAYFGQTVDFENEGNAGKCPVFTPNTYDQDECFQDGDGGLINPPAYTIQGPVGLETVVPCVASQTGSLGQVCQTAVWGTDIDIQVVNNNADARRFVNVLADWNRNGKWAGSMTCPSGVVADEHVLANFAIPAGYSGPLSNLNPPNFAIGPYPGYVWFRFMISESLILAGTVDGVVYDWDGSGSFRDGETEDYLLDIDPVLKPYDCDWNEGDGHKMHWPQLPDLAPTGVDVDNFWVPLADDFLCTQSGPIRDIHIWGSFAGDCLPPAGVGGMTFKLTIWTNVPANADSTMPWSRPGERKWTRVFEPCQYTVRRVDEEGPEDWYDPATGLYQRNDHFQVYQYNFCIDEEPFMVQEEGTIYWLEVKDITPDDAGATFGWKTTNIDLRWMDDAVWRNEDPAIGPIGWLPLKYPEGHEYQGTTLDLAFVITGEKEPCGWKPGDPYKMHFPQLPDPEGWDVDVVAGNISADDWKCSATGTVDDIHFWYSWLGDKVGIIDNIHASIHSNVAADDPTNPSDHSVPGELLWERDFGPDEFSLCYWGSGNQGFLMPGSGGGVSKPNDHKMIFQCDIVDIPDPFPQERGKIYWLDLSIKIRDPLGTHIGWKTSQDHFEDDAVYDAGAAGWPGWREWIDPFTMESLDLAFVITGKEEVAAHELGDAPDSSNSFLLTPMAYPKGGPAGVQANYPTVFVAGSPPHGPIHLQPKAAAWLGPAVTLENEADIGPDEDAVNNIDPPNDTPDQDQADDGVQVPLVLPHCQQTTFDYGVQIAPGAPHLDLYVNVWFDFNRDGDWDDAPQCPSPVAVIVADEWAVQNQKLSGLAPGYYVFSTPLFRCWHPISTEPQPIWMRITLSEQEWSPVAGTVGYGGSGPANGYLYGETEDYYFVPGMPEYDWGDAPDSDALPAYPTLAANNGAHHIIGGPWLGNAGDAPDSEPDGQPDLNALGDDLDTGAGNPAPNHDDEDGVFIPPLIRGQTVYATIQVSGGGGTVQAWVDLNGDKVWQAAEQVFNAFRGGGFHAIPIPVPNTAVLGQTFARLRISVNGGLGPDGGPAADGEVEDHEVWINDPPPNTKWINLPDLTPSGIDIRADRLRILADDFECTSYSRVTDVHLWCSWKDDIKGEIKNIHLSIHADDPAGPGGPNPDNLYSEPAPDPLWTGDFGPGEFKEELYYVVPYPHEYWWDPANNELIRHGDSEVWQIDIDINPDEAFLQKGSPDNPVIYWLDVRFETENGQIGWKTRQWPQHFMDDAVWDMGSELPRIWKELRYPKGHPYHGLERDSIDMAFVITSTEEGLPPKPAIKHLKWSQPPIEIDPRSKTPLYCGWDQSSFATTQLTTAQLVHWAITADDFRCLGSMPITSVHWWGSYKNNEEGWQEPGPPAIKPNSWRIGFWSNVPANPNTEPKYSHPGKLLWQIAVPADKVHEERVGIDRFPNKPSDTCFQYYVELEPKKYFWQEKFIPNTRDNVFWISIVAVYDVPAGTIPFVWGWKTRPWHWMDDAVRFMYGEPVEVGLELPSTAFTPIEGELECAGAVVRQSFDMAFEFDTDPNYIKWEQAYTGIRDWRHYEDEESLAFERTVTEIVTKYRQEPDLSEKGVDVDATLSLARPQTLADDFECTTTGPLTDVHIWGSWYNDEPPGGDPCNVVFRLSIHKDIPANSDAIPPYSMPGEQLWEGVFQPGQFTVERVSTNAPEGYYNACGPLPVVPPTNYVPQNHFKVFKYNFYINADEAFMQEGTADKPIVYWLDVQAQPILIGGITDARFGWKTSLEHWNDDAVWRTNIMPISRPWEELRYPDGHPYHPNSIDLAFEITTETEEKELKVRRLVADDWLCKRETPVTAAVWWGSYIGYSYEACACPVMAPPVKPDYFLLSIWSDVRPTDEVPYSHPGEKMWHYKAYDYDEVLVGYDKHPHGAPNEPVFRYSVRLPEDKWFCQDGVDQIYWFSAVAVYKEGTDPPYPWGWTNHQCQAWEPPGLVEVAHLKFDETGGSTASDSSGNNNHGTLVGDPTWKPCCGAVCGALDLDGDGDYVKTADTTTGLDFAPSSFSASVWINAREVADGWRTILEYDRDGSDDNRFGLWLSSEGKFHFRVGRDTKNSDENLDPDKWYLLTGTYNATDKKMSLYINGNFDSSRILTKGFDSSKAAKLTIGVCGSEDDEFFNGLIDDLRIYDYVLSAEEVKALAGMKRNDDAVAGHVDTTGAAPVWDWKELYDQTGMSEDMSFILFTDCFPCTYSTYPDWLALGKPRCWCAPPAGTGYQCDGDADGGTETFFKYRVYGNDINLVVGNWKRKAGDPLLDPCADIDHKSETFFEYRVYGKDLATVVTNWKKKDRGEPYDPTTQLPGDCPRPE